MEALVLASTDTQNSSTVIEVGVGTLSHTVTILKEDGAVVIIKEGLGLADAMRIASLHSRNINGYARVIHNTITLAIYYKGELT